MKSGVDMGISRTLRWRMSAHASTSRSGFRYGSGCSNTAWVTLKIAAAAPIPKAIVATAVMVNTGLLRSVRAA